MEAELNAVPQFRTTIDGLGIHFLHARSPHDDALPLVMTHGWPGSVVEFLDVIGPLADPSAHGGDTADAFHVICPSLPGYAWSAKPTTLGWGVERIAKACAALMDRRGTSDTAHKAPTGEPASRRASVLSTATAWPGST